MGKWIVQIKGEECGKSFEISVVREDNQLGRASWGWFNEKKLLISHNGGPCNWPLTKIVWDKMVKLAEEIAADLNSRNVPSVFK